jgi:hypothetical protein
MFVKFNCGCIGIKQISADGELLAPIIVKACDGEAEYSFYRRNHMRFKAYERLPLLEEDAIIKALGGLIGDGYDLRTMRRVLNIDINLGKKVEKLQAAICQKEKQ